jgi:uncharacterized membrane protein YedE/YeeE
MALFINFICGFLFAIGLALSGMTKPSKVINFLDFFGYWDPSLIFVMAGGMGIFALFYHLSIKQWAKPVMADAFCLSNNTKITKKLIIGSCLFGIGWGLVGICPGPAITNIATFSIGILAFVASMFAGIKIGSVVEKKLGL